MLRSTTTGETTCNDKETDIAAISLGGLQWPKALALIVLGLVLGIMGHLVFINDTKANEASMTSSTETEASEVMALKHLGSNKKKKRKIAAGLTKESALAVCLEDGMRIEAMCGASAGQVSASNVCTKDICADKTAFLNDPACATSMGRDGYLVLGDLFLSNCTGSVKLKEITVACGDVDSDNDRSNGKFGMQSLDLSGLTTILGSLKLNNNWGLKEVELSSLTSVGGDLVFDENSQMESLKMSRITCVGHVQEGGGKFRIYELRALQGKQDFSRLLTVGRNLLYEDNTAVTAVDFSSLVAVGTAPELDPDFSFGQIWVRQNDNMETLDLSSLETVAGRFAVDTNFAMEVLEISKLSTVGKSLLISDNHELNSITLSQFMSTGPDDNIDIKKNYKLEILEMPKLENVTRSLFIQTNPQVQHILMPGLVETKSLRITDNYFVKTIDLSKLVTVKGSFEISEAMGLELVDLSSLASVDGEFVLLKTVREGNRPMNVPDAPIADCRISDSVVFGDSCSDISPTCNTCE